MPPFANNPIGLSEETVSPFAKRQQFLVRFGMGALGLFLLSFLVFAYAETPYTVDSKDLDTSAFPSVELTLNMADPLAPTDLALAENGKTNIGPLLLIPPGEPVGPDKTVKKIDLFILLDKSGNIKPFESTIKGNLKAMIGDLEIRKIDARYSFVAVGGYLDNVTSTIFTPPASMDAKAFGSALDSLVFEEAKLNRIYALESLNWMKEQMPREGSQKVTLVAAGTPFYDVNSEVKANIPKLGQAGNLTFFLGQPLRQLFSAKGKKAEDLSLNRIPGGYLGNFSSDLTLITHLLSRRSPKTHLLRYFSNLMPSEASGAIVSLVAGAVPPFTFSYPTVSVGLPDYTLRQQLVGMGDEQPVEIALDPKGQWIDTAEVYTIDGNNTRQYMPLIHSRSLDANGKSIFTGSLPKSALVSGVLRYDFSIHTPFNVIEKGDFPTIQKWVSCDPAIRLEYQLHPNSVINWKWSGQAVDAGVEYKLLSGETEIKSFAGNGIRSYQVPVGQCDYYQIVKLGVRGPDGQWAYSCPVEANFLKDTGADGPTTEKEGVERLFQCLDPKVASSLSDYVAGKGIDYTPAAPLSLGKMLYHLTGLMDPASQGSVLLKNYYRVFYFMATYFSREEVELYGKSANPIPRSLLFKAITGANQSKDFANQLKNAVEFMNSIDYDEGT